MLSADEGLRRGTSPEKLAGLKPAFKEGGVIHAGNSSQISDGAAAVLMMTSDKARELGLTPHGPGAYRGAGRGRPGDHADRAIPATLKALKKSGLSIGDIGAFEVNEVFAPVTRWPGWPRPAPTRTGSTRAAARSPSATRSARPAPG